MSDLKPVGVKAPMNLLPARPLRAIAAAMEHGAVKYAPWNWQEDTDQATIDELYAAAMRHLTKASDPSEDDFDDESRLHHLTHLGACVLILLFKLGIDYQASEFVMDRPYLTDAADIVPDGMYTNCCTPAMPDAAEIVPDGYTQHCKRVAAQEKRRNDDYDVEAQ